jgi:hypothetical protein
MRPVRKLGAFAAAPGRLALASWVATGLFAVFLGFACWPSEDLPANAARANPAPTPAAGPTGPQFLAQADLGIRLAYARIDPSGIGTLVIQLTDGAGEDVTGANGVFTGIAWSPDGSQLGVSFGPSDDVQDVYTVAVDGSDLTRRTNDGHSRRPAWSPDGLAIAYSNGAAGGGPVMLLRTNDFTSTPLSPAVGYDHPAWAPDGSSVALTREPGTMVLVAPSTGEETRVVQWLRDSAPTLTSFDWSDDSTAVAGVTRRGDDLAVTILGEGLTFQRQVGGAFLGHPPDPASPHPSWVPGFPKLIAASWATGDIMLIDLQATPQDMPDGVLTEAFQVLVPAPPGFKLAFPAVSPFASGGAPGSIV